MNSEKEKMHEAKSYRSSLSVVCMQEENVIYTETDEIKNNIADFMIFQIYSIILNDLVP